MEAVITTKFVLHQHSPILTVYRDHDGWQFLSNDGADLSAVMVVGLNQIIKQDASVIEIISILKPGFSAHRERIGAQWEIREFSE
jgi:hypothetical protein